METLTAYASDGEKPKKRHYECPISSATEFEKLKLRRPKVSAVRDFPVGFEQTNAQSNSCKDDWNAEPYDTDHVEPNYNSCHSDEDNSSLCSLESEVETDDGFDCAKLGIKRPKVSAIRDFPVAFQQYGSQANGAAGDSDGDVVELLEIDHAEPCEPDHVEPNYNSYHFDEDNSSLCSLESEVETDDGFDCAKLGIKRPKVSAIRDFPVAFQQFGSQANGAAGDSDGDVVELLEIDHAEPCDTDHVEPNYNSCHSDEDNSSLCSLESEVETDDGFDCAKLGIKRPKVSAIRDFPVAFQQFGSQANGAAGDSDGDVVVLLEIDHDEPCEPDHVEPNENTPSSEETDSCLGLQSVAQTDDGCYFSGDLDNATHNDTLEVLDREKRDKLKLQYALNKVSDFVKLGFKWPKVSAIRDFPLAFEQFGAQANGTVNDSD